MAAIEELGYGTLWFGETPTGKEALTHAALLLSASRRLMIATGIASIYGRDATAAAAGASIAHGDLSALLYLQGYRQDEFSA